MAFWDDLNQQAQQRASQGGIQSWEQYAKLERVKQVMDERKKKSQQPESKGNFLTSLLPTGGGIAGTLGGAAAGAAAGSVVPIVGTAVGGLLGAILGGAGGSALGKVGQNAVEGEQDLGKGVGGEALMGGLTALPVGAGIKVLRAGGALAKGASGAAGQLIKEAGASTIPKMAGGLQAKAAAEAAGTAGKTAATTALKTSGSGRLTDMGNKALTSQYGTISKPVARATNPEKTFGQLADAGLTKPQDVESVASSITGADGLVNKAVLNAVGKSGGVDTSTLRQVFQDAMENYGIVDADKKSLNAVFEAQMKKLSGGPAGSLSKLADPNDALAVMKSLEKRMADLTGKGSNYRLTTPERGDKANALRLVRDELQDKLYAGAGANSQLSTVLTPQFREEVVNLMPNNPRWAQYVDNKVMNAKDVGELRSSMAPFVNAGKIIDEADVNSMTFGGRAGDAFRSGGVRNMVADAGAAMVKNPAARVAAGVLRSAGGREASAGAGQTLMGAGIRQSVPRGIEGALMSTGAPGQEAVDENGLTAEDYQTLSSEGIDLAGGGLGGDGLGAAQPEAPTNPFGYSSDQVAQGMTKAAQVGNEKAYAQLSDLYDRILKYESGPGGGKTSSATGKALAQSANADQTLAQLEGLLQTAGGAGGPLGGGISSALGNLGLNNNAKTYNDLADGSISQIAKALGETGTLSDSDRLIYKALLPKITDTPEVAANKFAALRARMATAQQNTLQYGSGSGLEEALASAGYN